MIIEPINDKHRAQYQNSWWLFINKKKKKLGYLSPSNLVTLWKKLQRHSLNMILHLSWQEIRLLSSLVHISNHLIRTGVSYTLTLPALIYRFMNSLSLALIIFFYLFFSFDVHRLLKMHFRYVPRNTNLFICLFLSFFISHCMHVYVYIIRLLLHSFVLNWILKMLKYGEPCLSFPLAFIFLGWNWFLVKATTNDLYLVI